MIRSIQTRKSGFPHSFHWFLLVSPIKIYHNHEYYANYKKSGGGLVAREENRKRPGRRFLPFEGFYLFHSELAGGARQQEARTPVQRRMDWTASQRDIGNTKSDSDSMLTYRMEKREVQ